MTVARWKLEGEASPAFALRWLVDAIPDCVLVIDSMGVIRFLNEATEEQLGYGPDWIGRSIFGVIHEDDLAVVLSSMETVQGKAVGTPVEVRVRDSHGRLHWYEEIGRSVEFPDGSTGIVCVARNITQRRMWEVAAGDLSRFQHLVQVSPAITLLLDGDGVVNSVNAAFTRLLGHDPSVVVGRTLLSFVEAQDVELARSALARLRDGEESVAFETRMRVVGQPSQARPVRFELVSHIADPVVNGIVVSGYDVTELAAARSELEYLARHDALTGLSSRSRLVEHMEQQLLDMRAFAVLFIDLDRFKPVNDLWGHEIGDELLRQVAERLESAIRPGDLAARVGGDEFVVVADAVYDAVAASALASRIEERLTAPYHLGVGKIRIGASVGIALSTHDATVAGMLAEADMAMYDAKAEVRGGQGRSSIDRKRSAAERRRLIDEFAAGLGRGEIVAHLQPIVSAMTGEMYALEALARWNHPQHGVLLPAAFLDLVEDAGLTASLGDAVLASACSTIARLAELGSRPLLGINLSVGQLTDTGITGRIAEVLAVHGVDPHQLVIEITEQAMLAPPETAVGIACDTTLRALHAIGATLSLDDFGTGYSSLSHIRRFPLGSIKIDRSFTAGILHNREDRVLIEAIVNLAHALGLRAVVEGIENRAQLQAAQEVGADLLQGYYLAVPMSGADVVRWAFGQVDDGGGSTADVGDQR